MNEWQDGIEKNIKVLVGVIFFKSRLSFDFCLMVLVPLVDNATILENLQVEHFG